MINNKFSSHKLKRDYLYCCFYELKINKPGNVSIFSPILGMDKKKFFHAAEISSSILSNRDFSLGESILKSCKSCMKQLDSNYNLGIILLCAPVIKAALKKFCTLKDFKKNLSEQLININALESRQIFQAIKLCKPGGLNHYNGKGNLLSFKQEKIGFHDVMKISSKWDRISKAYNDHYKEIFDKGLPLYKNLKKKFSNKYSTECLFMYFLSIDLDSHLQRKYGTEKAREVLNKSKVIYKKIILKEDINSNRCLSFFDNYLKKNKLNPGTCADLTVTTLLIDKITDMISFSDLKKI